MRISFWRFATEAQHRIDAEIGRMTASELEGTKLDQAGLRDGLAIIEAYVRVGELGVAFDHVLYMVEETGISLSPASVRFLEETAASSGLPAPRVPVAR